MELAYKMRMLLADQEKMHIFSQRSIKSTDRFKAQKVYEAWNIYFQKLLEG